MIVLDRGITKNLFMACVHASLITPHLRSSLGRILLLLSWNGALSSQIFCEVVAVIDLGLHRRVDHDASKGIASLATKWWRPETSGICLLPDLLAQDQQSCSSTKKWARGAYPARPLLAVVYQSVAQLRWRTGKDQI